jgi:hypothetical protein
MSRRSKGVVWGVTLALLAPMLVGAGGLGIPLDGFLATFLIFIIGLGVVVFMLGLGSYVYQWVRHEAC